MGLKTFNFPPFLVKDKDGRKKIVFIVVFSMVVYNSKPKDDSVRHFEGLLEEVWKRLFHEVT